MCVIHSVICTPENFWSRKCQDHLEWRRDQRDHNWIFDLCDGITREDETIYIKTDEWLLCKDKHPGNDMRYLVVFRDKSLFTIRNLDQTHLGMLKEVKRKCSEFIAKAHQSNDWKMFFHYSPSVIQLHMHITRTTAFSSLRLQPLNCIIRNLALSSTYYRDALILSPSIEKRVRHAKKWKPKCSDTCHDIICI